MLASVLYAEVYFICMIVVGLLLFWSLKSESRSSSEQWQIRMLSGFMVCFSANLLFTLFQMLFSGTSWGGGALYTLKSLYYFSLIAGTYFWCGYAETELRSGMHANRLMNLLFILPFMIPTAMVAANLWTHSLFDIDSLGQYHRHGIYHWYMLSLTALTVLCSGRHFTRAFRESDPVRRGHMLLTASFPLSLVLSWVVSQVGEQIPVVCVCITVELLCLYVGTTRQQISLDKLTQVNNRQNLISYLEYKLATHESRMYLLMIDLDDFKIINDNYGHLEGDKALILVAQALKEACGSYKLRPYIARYGGDEFMVITEGTRSEANELCENIRRLISEKQDKDAPYVVKASIGLAECTCGMKPDDLILAADEEMYRIKKERKAAKAAEEAADNN
ncbi:MAG: GGDEF domain-containing protein [Clostridia bacterium]|nr:GGDEF domain-containing protein [Clostridia bacterium]MBR0220070.1 GGDEF domain-containing protein [Clostridia bacterium]